MLGLNATAMENNVVAVASGKGLAVIDCTGLPSVARRMRALIAHEFGRKHSLYLINPHDHGDHARGNTAFSDAGIMAWEGVGRSLLQSTADMARIVDRFERRPVSGRRLFIFSEES